MLLLESATLCPTSTMTPGGLNVGGPHLFCGEGEGGNGLGKKDRVKYVFDVYAAATVFHYDGEGIGTRP